MQSLLRWSLDGHSKSHHAVIGISSSRHQINEIRNLFNCHLPSLNLFQLQQNISFEFALLVLHSGLGFCIVGKSSDPFSTIFRDN